MTREVYLKHSDSKVIFERGRFDDFCVYIVKNDNRKAPTDVAYFDFFKKINDENQNLEVYNDFVTVYEETSNIVEQNTLGIIDDIVINSGLEGDDKKVYEGYLVVIYFAMIAEENKANTRLGKRIKRLGMYNLLIENESPSIAANSSRGKGWRELAAIMESKGF